ncbi:unnamed protein product, partial [Rotaria sp. Silwood2]
ADRYSLGHLLLTGSTSKDAIASWCSVILLAHLIADNPKRKENILNVISAVGQSPTGAKTLLEITIDLLKNFISQIRNPSIENDPEALMSSLHAFVLGVCLISNNNTIEEYSK